MKYGKYLIALVAVAALAGGYVYSRQTDYHNFRGRCLECHLTEPAPGDTPRTFVKDIDEMCYTCHSDVKELSHPVGVIPTMKVSKEFPLDWSGKITCVTCHPAHKFGSGPSHLRSRASGQGFCVMCHDNLDTALHETSVGSAHMGTTMASGIEVGELGATLDTLSLKCLACHDATTAPDSLVDNAAIRNTVFHDNTDIGLSHPIGMSYYDTKRKYFGAYRDVKDLPKEIKLYGGIVGCGSCHNPYSKLHSELVMSNEKSALCLACHVK